MKPVSVTLTPAQQSAFDGLVSSVPMADVFVLSGRTGKGRTTVLQEAHQAIGGTFLAIDAFLDAMQGQHPLAMEETFLRLVSDALSKSDAVIVDDLHLINDVVCDCGGMSFYPRKGLLDAALTALAAAAGHAGKKLIFGCGENIPGPLRQRCYPCGIDAFTTADYAHLCGAFLGPAGTDAPRPLAESDPAGRLDYGKIFRFAPKLNAHQIQAACLWLRKSGHYDTEHFIEYLRSQRMASNVELAEVQAVDLNDLKGVDDVIRSLEANIILPLEDDALATELNIKPKRGVLLAGPPGTGKTTIGRALAHRLKSKFFLVDGTFISGTRGFYGAIQQVFEAAQQNAPSIIFIDDSDVIFESGQEMGLYRYLLTMLDGLESASAGRVCVMMTAMDVSHLPPALIRSGRIELWLETSLPDEEARTAILGQHIGSLPAAIGSVDVARVVEATEGLTGADLKRLIEDGKILFAYDKSRRQPLAEPTQYFLQAVEAVRTNKERYAEAEAQARAQRPVRPPWFDMFDMMAAADGAEGDE